MVIFENKIVSSIRTRFAHVTTMPPSPNSTTSGKEISKAYKFERFEDNTPMHNQPTYFKTWKECCQWLVSLGQDGPHCESGTDGGGSGSSDQRGNVCRSIPKIGGECMAIIIVGEILAVPR
jgi:hypothetical protein